MWHDVRMLNAASNALLGVLAIALLMAGVWWCVQRPVFALKIIRVEGIEGMPLKYVNPLTIRGAAVPRMRGNFFTVELSAVRAAFEAVPWVRRASVRRRWPDQLVITVEEHQPLGIWGDEDRLVSVKGDLFTANLAEAEEDGDLPELAGPDGSEQEVVARFNDLRSWLAPAGLVPVGLQLSERYAWTAKLNNGVMVELGREQNREMLRARVERLVKVYPQLHARLQGGLEKVDLRYPNGLAVKASGISFRPDGKLNKQDK